MDPWMKERKQESTKIMKFIATIVLLTYLNALMSLFPWCQFYRGDLFLRFMRPSPYSLYSILVTLQKQNEFEWYHGMQCLLQDF